MLNIVLLLAIVASVGGSGLIVQDGNSPENIRTCHFNHYTSLGDSFSAGMNAWQGELPICDGSNGGFSGPYCTLKSCHQNNDSYAWGIHQAYAGQFDFLACAGANTDDLINNQLPLLNASTDMITYTIGGNNNELFSNAVLNCIFPFVADPDCNKSLTNAEDTIDNIDSKLVDVIDGIQGKAKNAKIAVLSYVQFFGNVTGNCDGQMPIIPDDQVKYRFNNLTLNLNQKLQSVAQAKGVDYINVDPFFNDHRFCDVSEDIWFQAYPNPYADYVSVWHPAVAGQSAYFNAFKQFYNC